MNLTNLAGPVGRGNNTLSSSWLLLAAAALTSTLNAASINHFDIIVADSEATIYALNPRTGERSIVAQQDKLARPYDLARDRDGNIVVSDSGTLRVVRVNPTTHEQTVLAEGGSLGVPYGLDVDQHSTIYVANSSSIVRITPDTHLVETFAQGGLLRVPLDVAVAPDGTVYVADALAGIIRIDAATRQQTLLTQAGLLHTPTGITVDGNLTAYVVDGSGRCVVAVDLRNGSQRQPKANQGEKHRQDRRVNGRSFDHAGWNRPGPRRHHAGQRPGRTGFGWSDHDD